MTMRPRRGETPELVDRLRERAGTGRWRRGLVVVLEVVIGLLAVATAFGDAVAFLMSYSSPLGTYTGQEDDRNAAWRLLLLAVPSVFLFVALMFLRVRRSRRRRGMSRVKTGTSS